MTNRYLGGNHVFFRYLQAWSRDWPKGQKITFLDVGTGDADIPISIVQWGRARGFDLRVTAIDSTPKIAEIARQNARSYPEIEVVEADFFSYAPGSETSDYVLCSLFLHHVPDDRLIQALKLCDHLARRGVIIHDLLRSPTCFYGIKALTALFGNRIVRNDGPLSVRRAFLPEELEFLARRADIPYLFPRRHSSFRLSLAGQKNTQYA